MTTRVWCSPALSLRYGCRAERPAAERIPLSGAARGKFDGDISVPLLGIDRVVEVKCRGNGFRRLYDWLIDRDLLIVRADRREPLVILPLRLAIEIAKTAEKIKFGADNAALGDPSKLTEKLS